MPMLGARNNGCLQPSFSLNALHVICICHNGYPFSFYNFHVRGIHFQHIRSFSQETAQFFLFQNYTPVRDTVCVYAGNAWEILSAYDT